MCWVSLDKGQWRMGCGINKYSLTILSKLSKMDQEVQDARARLAARYASGTQLGGKGKPLSLPSSAACLLMWMVRHPASHQKGGDYPEC